MLRQQHFLFYLPR